MKWSCLTPAVAFGFNAVDLVAANLAPSEFSLQEASPQNVYFTGSIGVATTATAGYYALSALSSTESGKRFEYSISLSLDDSLSDSDVKLSVLEMDRSLDKLRDK